MCYFIDNKEVTHEFWQNGFLTDNGIYSKI